MTHRVTYRTASGATKTEDVSDPIYYMWELLGDQGQANLRDRYLDQSNEARISGWKNTVARYKAQGVDIWARYRLQDAEHNFTGLSPGIPDGSFKTLKPGIPDGSFLPITRDNTTLYLILGAVILLITLYSTR